MPLGGGVRGGGAPSGVVNPDPPPSSADRSAKAFGDPGPRSDANIAESDVSGALSADGIRCRSDGSSLSKPNFDEPRRALPRLTGAELALRSKLGRLFSFSAIATGLAGWWWYRRGVVGELMSDGW